MESPSEPAPVTPPGPERGSKRRAILFVLIMAVIAAIIAAIAALPLIASIGWSPLDHFECRPGTVVAAETLWTPAAIVNAPYGGNATVTVRVSETTSETFYAHNGIAEGQFELRAWSVARSLRTLVAGPGSNAQCPEFLATSQILNEAMLYDLLPANSTSDVAEPTALPDTSYPGGTAGSVVFHNGYVSGDGRNVTTCGTGRGFLETTSSHLSVEIPFPWNGGTATAAAAIDYAANYTYDFPAGMGTWSLDDLNTGSNSPGGGFAFSFTPCP